MIFYMIGVSNECQHGDAMPSQYPNSLQSVNWRTLLTLRPGESLVTCSAISLACTMSPSWMLHLRPRSQPLAYWGCGMRGVVWHTFILAGCELYCCEYNCCVNSIVMWCPLLCCVVSTILLCEHFLYLEGSGSPGICQAQLRVTQVEVTGSPWEWSWL